MIRNRIKDILKELRKLSKKESIQKIVHNYLMSVPGVGFITAMTFYSEIISMRLFPTFDQLASFVGLVPDVDASGERETTTGLTFRRNRHLPSHVGGISLVCCSIGSSYDTEVSRIDSKDEEATGDYSYSQKIAESDALCLVK